MFSARPRLGQLLVDARILSSEQLEAVLTTQRSDGRKLGALLVESGLVTETLLTQILSQQLSVPWVSLNHIDFSRELLGLVPLELCEKYCLVPIYVRAVRGQGDTLYVAMEDPMNEEALGACTASSGLPARAMIAAPTEIFRVLRIHCGSKVGAIASAASTAAGAPVAASSGVKAAVGAALPGRAAAAPRAGGAGSAPIDASAKPPKDASSDEALPAAPNVPNVPESGVAASAPPARSAPSDAPELEVKEIDLSQKRKRQRQLTLLDGTTIQLPSAKKRTTGRRRSEPAPADNLTAADIMTALRAAAHGVDATDVLGESLRWEKMMAAVLALLMRKHLILERELLEELKKI